MFGLVLRVQVIEVAEELVEAVHRGQEFVAVPEMVLAELPADIALRLEQFGNRRVLVRKPFLGAGKADFQQARAHWALARDEGGAASRAGLLRVIVREKRAFVGNTIDVGRPISHHAAIIGADIPVADVVAHDDEYVGLLLLRGERQACGGSSENRCQKSNAGACHAHGVLQQIVGGSAQ
jgi:hypothetical protein